MYTSFFGLNEKPFSITPDPRYLFMSERHTEALAHLIYGVRESGGFIQLTGEVGTGKTTLVRSLLQQLPENSDVALILHPQLSRNEFLTTICEELGVALSESPSSIKTLINALNTYLLENHSRGRRTILIVDEAQNLRLDVLEQVRLLTNLETTKQKLLQIILIGQPELRELLDRTDMRQLAQRITGRYHLEPLSADETETYIEHRLKVAGGVGPIFSNSAKRELFRLSGGVPRRINVIADRAMLGAFTQESRQVSPPLLRKAASEVLDRKPATFSPWYPWRKRARIFAAVAVIALGGAWAWTAWPELSGMATELIADFETQFAKLSVDPSVSGEPIAPSEEAGISDPDLTPAVDTVNADPVPADQPPATASLDNLLRENQAVLGADEAFDTLFGFWGVSYVSGTPDPCRLAQQSNLYCLDESGSLAQVRRLDRPVILTLQDFESRSLAVVLSGLGDDVATVTIAGQNYLIDPAELGDFWFGQYLLLWKPQFDQRRNYAQGMRGAEVLWLRESLAKIQGEPVTPMSSDIFDSGLEARVRSYQRDRRLGVDGVVGYQTQIAINSDLGRTDRPSLSRVN
jgi:general secretion pathway protein A